MSINQPPDISNTHSISDIAAEDVRTELSQVISSKTFTDSPRLQEFMSYVVEETLAGRAGGIKGVTIAREVFHREDADDAQTSNIVRVEAGRLRRRLEDYYSLEGTKNSLRIKIPKGGYVPSFELLADDNKTDASNSSTEAKPDSRFKYNKSHFGVAFVAVFAVITAWQIAVDSVKHGQSSFTSQAGNKITALTAPAIAVLPFEDFTQDSNTVRLAAGLTEDIITDLAKLSGIDVIALSSILPYKNKTTPIVQIGQELNVSHILRGSIRGSGPQLRVTAQLYETQSGHQVWAERFDRQLDNELNLQDEIARNVVQSLSLNLQEYENYSGKNSVNPEAHALFKQAMHLGNPPSDPGRIKVALRAFERVIELDPAYAGGYAGAAYMYSFRVFWGHTQSIEEDMLKAVELADQALSIDSRFGLAYSAKAFIHVSRKEYDKAITVSQQAVNAQPNNPYVMSYYGVILCFSGQAQAGIEYAKRALRLDPLYSRTPYLNILGFIYYQTGQYQLALDAFLRSLERGGPNGPGIQAIRAATYLSLEQEKDAKTTQELLAMHNGGFSLDRYEAWLQRAFKNEADVQRIMQPLRELGIV